VLREIKDRFDAVPGLYLKSVEQKETEVTIRGESPNEASVTRFGQSLEFSSGLFTNLYIETLRETVQLKSNGASAPAAAAEDPNAAKPEVVSFMIKCNYSQPSGSQSLNPAPNPATQIAKK
jgi:hypothetical protein